MEQKLLNFGKVRGLVVGAWGEISEDFKKLMQVMADKKQEELQAQTGGEIRKSVTAQLATYVSQNRQQLSRICVQSQARLVLERKWDMERQAQQIAARQGWRIRRTGDFKM